MKRTVVFLLSAILFSVTANAAEPAPAADATAPASACDPAAQAKALDEANAARRGAMAIDSYLGAGSIIGAALVVGGAVELLSVSPAQSDKEIEDTAFFGALTLGSGVVVSTGVFVAAVINSMNITEKEAALQKDIDALKACSAAK